MSLPELNRSTHHRSCARHVRKCTVGRLLFYCLPLALAACPSVTSSAPVDSGVCAEAATDAPSTDVPIPFSELDCAGVDTTTCGCDGGCSRETCCMFPFAGSGGMRCFDTSQQCAIPELTSPLLACWCRRQSSEGSR